MAINPQTGSSEDLQFKVSYKAPVPDCSTIHFLEYKEPYEENFYTCRSLNLQTLVASPAFPPLDHGAPLTQYLQFELTRSHV